MNRTLDRPVQNAPTDAAVPVGSIHGPEGQLLDGLERVLRACQGQEAGQGAVPGKAGWMLLVLHLSRVATPRPHHRRIAAALLDETAERCAGQLFGLGNGDLALLFRPPNGAAGALDLVARLFAAEATAIETLRSLWPLPTQAMPALRYVRERTQDPPPPPAPPDPAGTAALDRLLRTAPLPVVLARQTAIHLRPGQTQRILPLFRELALGPRLLPSASRAEPEEERLRSSDMVARLEQRTLAGAIDALRNTTPMVDGLAVPLHLNLTPAGVMSESFARFAAGCVRSPGIRVAVEMALDAAFADPAVFLMARERLRLTGIGFVLDHVGAAALLITQPAALAPNHVKLDWTASLPTTGPAVAAAVKRMGADRTILAGCDTEAAVVWGLGVGIQRFQGAFVDAMLAAERLRLCPVGSGCSLLQCRLRAATLLPPDRALCRNHPLLDAATGDS